MRNSSELEIWHSLSVVAAFLCATVVASPVSARGADHETVPILVELFTSQGCSSCPPADRLLSRLAASDPSIIALAFHIDYWNHIGWEDPFSSPDWSQRQRRYAAKLGADHVYTPQIVVNGRRHGVGSDAREVQRMLRLGAADTSSARLEIELSDSEDGKYVVRLSAELTQDPGTGNLVAWIALVEDHLETPVGRGENANRTLHNDRVVRLLLPAFTLAANAGRSEADLELRLDPSWKQENLTVAAFLQDSRTFKVHASTMNTR